MSESLQPGLHPDPDSLSAFIEGVLPEHERLQCLTHLAQCPSCREVVYLAQEPLESEPLSAVPAVEKVSFWKRWFTPVYALSAAAAGVLVLSFALYQHYRAAPKMPEMVATATHPDAPASAPPSAQAPVDQPAVAEKIAPRARIAAVPNQEKSSEVTDMAQQPAAAVAAPVASPVAPAPAAAATAAPTVAAPRPLAAFDASNIEAMPTGITGTITDPAGAAIAGAAVKLRPLTGPAGSNLTSDPKGQFNVAGLEPGRYELQVVAPGFKALTRQVDVQPNQLARADSTLSVGSVADSISVTAEAARVQTSSGAAGGGRGGRGGGGGAGVQPLPARAAVTFSSAVKAPGVTDATIAAASQAPTPLLPNKLPAKMTAVAGKVTLAADSTGALFLSENSGQKWKTVKPVWHGTVASLVSLPAHASTKDPAFQLTTDTGSVWLSRDGSHWYASSPKRAPSPK